MAVPADRSARSIVITAIDERRAVKRAPLRDRVVPYTSGQRRFDPRPATVVQLAGAQ
jgi:hypothetical protein